MGHTEKMSKLSMKFGDSYGRPASSRSMGYYNLPPRAPSSQSHRSISRGSFSMANTGYRILQDDEDKWGCEIPVDPILMEKTGAGVREQLHEWKLNKRTTLPEDCNLETIDVACDKKKCVVKVSCDKIEGHTRCMSRESRLASRAGSRCGSAYGGYGGYESSLGMGSGYTTPNHYGNGYGRPDSAASNRELRALNARNSETYRQTLCKELKLVEDSDKRWEAHFDLGEKFVGDSNSVKVYKRNSHVIVEKKIPIPPEVQQSTVSTYLKDGVAVMMGIKRPPPVQTTVSGDMGYSKEAAKTINPPVEPVLSVNTTNQAELHKEMTQKHQVELSAPPPAAPISAAPTIPAPTTLSPSTPTQNTGATPTRKSSTAATRERKLSTASNMSSKSIDEKHEELTKEEDDEAEMATNVVKVMENSATKWAVALRVAKIFIA